jgi:hypothetical protein
MRHLQIIIRENGNAVFPSADFPILFHDAEEFLRDEGERLGLSGARKYHLLYDADTISQDDEDKLHKELKVIWNWWRTTQSDFHYREIGEVDLGNLDV